MKKRSRIGVATLTLIGLLVSSSVALAEKSDDKADTVFNYGYDAHNQVLIWGTSPSDGLYDCSLENGALTATYGESAEQGVIPVDSLEDDEGIVSFENRPEEELADDLEPATEPIEYSGASGECGVSGASVAGPNGQINHGMFMKLFNQLFEGQRRGCLNRILAKSDLGKGDTKVKTSDVEDIEYTETGEITFSTAVAACDKHEKADKEGKKEKKGRPDSPGKSGEAPGKNK